MSRLRVGKVRRKLSAMLAAHGLLIEPQFLDVQDGALCRAPGNDLARWFGLAHWRADLRGERGLICYLSSWDKMTDCVRHGFELLPDRLEGWRQVEVVAKQIST